jgi:glycerol-3-phosphate dehydrogenase (NAD(P)+)
MNTGGEKVVEKITVLGAGSWGTALAVLLSEKGYDVCLWARRPELVESIRKDQENRQYLPGVAIPKKITLVHELKKAVESCYLIVMAVPSHAVRDLSKAVGNYLSPKAIIVNTAKGIETQTLLRLSQVISEELFEGKFDRIAVLSGPSHAEEVALKLPTAVVIAAGNKEIAEIIQDVFMSPYFRVYINKDILGVEIAGALKNIIALGTGVSDGLGYGDNTKAAMITRGLAEITRLGLAMGGDAQTFAGLAGIGDLVVTCTSMYSRNRRAGIQIGQGQPLKEVLQKMGMVVEGVNTCQAAYFLAQKWKVKMPITEETYKVLFEGKNPREAVISLMTRSKTYEGEKEILKG